MCIDQHWYLLAIVIELLLLYQCNLQHYTKGNKTVEQNIVVPIGFQILKIFWIKGFSQLLIKNWHFIWSVVPCSIFDVEVLPKEVGLTRATTAGKTVNVVEKFINKVNKYIHDFLIIKMWNFHPPRESIDSLELFCIKIMK